MSVFDVTKETTQEIEEISWCCGAWQWNLVQRKNDHGNIYFKDIFIGEADCSLVGSKEHAENLIKALQKAIELGWVK